MRPVENEQSKSDYLFWQGQARLIAGKAEHIINCRIFLRSLSDLRICSDNPFGFRLLGLDNNGLKIDLPGLTEPADVFIQEWFDNNRGEATLSFQLRRSPIWSAKSEQLHLGRTAIVNFSQYWMGSPKRNSFELKSCGWAACFIPISEETLVMPTSMQSDNYRVTYQVEFSREDNSVFTVAAAQEFLEHLSIFLSFCQGQWVATSLTSATDADGALALEQWGTGRVSSWREPSGWLDEHHGECIVQLYDKFCAKLMDSSWNRTLSAVVYWLARADTNTAGTDGACILLQTSLERIAWHILVIDRKILSKRLFETLSAADQIRHMLKELSIPAAIPEGLDGLKALAGPNGLDGPGVFTLIRNRLVHPPKTEGSKSLPYYEAYCLAKWYVELSVLSVCGYLGQYSNCTLRNRWKGQVECVPWA